MKLRALLAASLALASASLFAQQSSFKDAERAVSSFIGQPVTGESLWKRGGPDKVEEREAKLDRYGPRRHEMTVASRSRDA